MVKKARQKGSFLISDDQGGSSGSGSKTPWIVKKRWKMAGFRVPFRFLAFYSTEPYCLVRRSERQRRLNLCSFRRRPRQLPNITSQKAG